MKHATLFRFIQKLLQLHRGMLSCIMILGLMGCLMMFSAGGGHLDPWASRQIVRFAFGLILMSIVALTPSVTLMRYAYPFYAFCLLFLVATEIAGYMGKGAQRWMDLGYVNLQPSELMKIGLILALGRYFHMLNPDAIRRFPFLIPPLILIALPVLLILKQPNLGTATIVSIIGVIILFTIGVQLRYFIVTGLLGLAALPIAWQFLHDYQKQRVLTFMNPEADPLGSGYNIMQSMIAIGSGGLFGKGFLQGSQGQLDFLPEKQTDFIFTMLAEEFGFIGGVCMLLMYLALILYGFATAARSRNLFGTVLATGISAMLLAHMAINVAMVMGLVPVVGLPLPMLSYGGSILITMMLGFGLLLNSYANRDQSLVRSTWGGI